MDKHTVEGELPVQLCNYTDAYKNDLVRPGPDLMRATATADEIRKNRLRIGDTVFTKDSEDPKDIGISAFVDGEADDFVCGYHLAIARPFEATHPRFLNWALRARPALDHFNAHAAGISRYGISISDLRAAPVPSVCPEQQERIAGFLDDRVSRIDRIITARREQVALIRNQLSARLERHLLRFSERVRSSRLMRVLPGYAFSSGEYSEDPSDVALLRGVNIGVGKLRWDDVVRWPADKVSEVAQFRLQPGDVVLGMDRPWIGDGLRIAQLLPDDGHPLLLQRVAKLIPGPDLHPRFMIRAYQSHAFREQVESMLTGLSVPHLSGSQILDYRMPHAKLSDQAAVAAEIDHEEQIAEQIICGLERSTELLTEYKSSLITAAIAGEVDVTTAGSTIPG